MGSIAQKLVKGSFFRVTEFMASAIVGLILMPFIIHSLGDKQYGLWIFVGSFLGYYGLLDFGLMSAIQRFVSRATGTDDKVEENKIINTAFVIFALLGVIALFVSVVLAIFTPVLFKKIEDASVFRTLVLILGMSFAFGFPLRVFSGILRAHLRYDVGSIIELCLLVIRTVLTIVLLKQGFGIIALAVLTFALDISGHGIKYLIVKRLFPYILISKQYIDRTRIKTLFSYSIYTFISQIADQLKYNVDNLVIVAFMGLIPVTLYSIGSRLIKYFGDFIAASVGVSIPLFSHYEGKGDFNSIKEKYLFLTKISGYLSILIGGTLIIFGKSFIARWVGAKYSEAYYILLILLIPYIFSVMQSASGGVIYGLSKHRFYTILNIIEGISNLVLSIIFVKKYGLYGVALGTAIPMMVSRIIILPIYTCKIVNLSYKDYYTKLFIPIIFMSSIILLSVGMLIHNLITPNYFRIAILVCTEIIIFSYIIYKIGFSYDEKIMLKQSVGLK